MDMPRDVHYGYTNTYASKNCMTPEKEEIPTQRYSASNQAVAVICSECFETNFPVFTAGFVPFWHC